MIRLCAAAFPASLPPPGLAKYVFACNAITDRESRAAAGLGARTIEDLQATLGVAPCRRRCTDCARDVLAGALVARAARAVGGDD